MPQPRPAESHLPRLPADACPYRRPFAAGFDECPAYVHRSFVGFDLQHRALRPVNTCRHLVTGDLDNRRYPRCELGDAAAREEWARSFREGRLDNLKRVSEAFQGFLQPQLAEIHRAKAEQLRNRSDPMAQRRLREVAAEAQESSEKWLRESREQLEAAGLPLEPCLRLVDIALTNLVAAPSISASYPISDDQLAEFPAAVRSFIRASPAAGSESPAYGPD